MGNNNEIRKRMETCRSVLLVLVWIGAIAGVIIGGSMTDDRHLGPFGIALIIVAVLGGIIGHFLVNVCLAIPFILLNNGDYLEVLKNSFTQQLEFIPTHCVKLLSATDGLSLRKRPDPNLEPFTKLINGTEVQLLNTGDNVEFQGIKAPWFEIRSEDGICGWCFSGSLKKI